MADCAYHSDDELNIRQMFQKKYAARPPPPSLRDDWHQITKPKQKPKNKVPKSPTTSDIEIENAE